MLRGMHMTWSNQVITVSDPINMAGDVVASDAHGVGVRNTVSKASYPI